MRHDGLENSYWQAQIARVETLRQKIADRTPAVPGRIIPDDQDLAIGTGRRLPATILFTDITGFSSRPSSTAEEQEMILRVLNLYFTEMIRIIEDYGGTVEKNTGDGLMSYFEEGSANSAGENCAQRAIACSLTMLATNELVIAPILRASNVPPIQFRISMEHGDITIARIGAAQRFNANVAIGNPANFACKMLGNIKAGEIAIGANLRSRLPADWQSQWTLLSPVSTGWVYINTNTPYPLYLYTGRWSRLV